MKQKTLTNSYLSLLSEELAMLLDAGLTMSDSIQILHENEPGKDGKAVMQILIDELAAGATFAQALRNSKMFPRYMSQMVETGERTGRLVETLKALSDYYERQIRLSVMIKNSVMYPTILLVLMIAVVLILVVQVLPIFNDVFGRLGTQMSPLAIALMDFGQWLGGASIAIAVVFFVLFLAVLIGALMPNVRKRVFRAFANRWGGRGVFGKIASSRFVFAMTLAMASGLDTADAIDIAGAVSGGTRAVDDKHKKCVQLINSGKPLHEALTEADILSLQDGKMLSIGSRSGKADVAMAEIARRSDIEVTDSIDRIVSRIEPTLVIISSVIVGVILLSVMLPLMGIMTAIG